MWQEKDLYYVTFELFFLVIYFSKAVDDFMFFPYFSYNFCIYVNSRICFFSIFYINGTVNKHLLFIPYAAYFGRCSREGALVCFVQMDSSFTVVHANMCGLS